MKSNSKTKKQLVAENEDFRRRLEEAEETLRAIHEGEVDALVLSQPQGDVVFTLQGAEHPYRVFVEAMNEGAVTLASEGTILYCNDRFAEMLNLSSDRVIGTSIHEFIPPADRFGFESAFRAGMQQDTTVDIFLWREDQVMIPVHLSFSMLQADETLVVCMVAMDLTEHKRLEKALVKSNAELESRVQERTERLRSEIAERKRAEEVIRESESRFRAIFENSMDGILVTDPRGKGAILSANPAACRMLGWPEEELIGKDWEFILDMDDPRLASLMQGRGRRGSYMGEIVYKRKDGTRFPVEITTAVFHDNKGEERAIVVARDITERKRGEEELRKSEERFRLAESLAKMGHFEWDIANNVTVASPSLLKIYGLEAGSLKGKFEDWMEMVHADDKAKVTAIIHSAFSEKRVRERFEFRIIRPDGAVRWISTEAAAKYDERGRPETVTGAMSDITEREQAEDALRKSEARTSLLSQVATALLASQRPEETIIDVCRPIMEYLDCQVFFHFLEDEETGRLRLNAFAGIPEEEAEKLAWLEHGREVYGCVAQERHPVVAEDIQKSPDLRTDLIKGYGIQAYACYPLIVGGGFFGTLSFGTKTRTHFPPEDRDFMDTISNRVAVALERVRILRELHRSHEELEARIQKRTQELQQSKEVLQHLSLQLMSAQETERKRIAAELHDSICSALAGIKITLENRLGEMKHGPSYSGVGLEDIIDAVQRCNDETRKIMNNLRPGMLDDLGLLPTINWYCREFQKTNPHLSIQSEISLSEEDLPEPIKIVIYRVMQEAMNNAAKHGLADIVRISLTKETSQIQMAIQDNGRGFDPETASFEKRGMGLLNMRERVQLSGGTYSLDSRIGEGTTIRASWPVREAISQIR
jgi:PAS domain S-box-containing protein